jgi:uncharacterized protein (DUF58 family)
MEKKLNLDIPGSVASFELLMKKVLPKNIFYKIIYGKGVDFDGYRDYVSDEDSSNIDWKASVRAQKTLSRKYIEERDLKILFFIDVSDNMIFGSSKKLKCEYAAELVSALMHLILVTGDKVGFVLYNDGIVRQIIYGYGERQFNIFREEISNPENYGGDNNLDLVLKDLIDSIDKDNSLIFIVSDFVKLNESNKEFISLLGKSFETVALVIKDSLDLNFPNINKEIILEDPATGERITINPFVARKAYEENTREQTETLKKIFNNSDIDFRIFKTDHPFPLTLAEFLKQRSERRVYH